MPNADMPDFDKPDSTSADAKSTGLRPDGSPDDKPNATVDKAQSSHRQLVRLRSRWRVITTASSWLRRSGDAGDPGPNLKGSGPGGSILDGWDSVSAEQEEVADPVMGGEEALCLARRLEPLHLPLSSSHGLVQVLPPVVRVLAFPVLDIGHDFALGRPATRQLVGDHDTQDPVLPLELLAPQPLGYLRVAAASDKDVERHPVPVDRTSEAAPHAGNRDHGLVHVLLIVGGTQPTLGSVGRASHELLRLLPFVDPLRSSTIVDADAARGQQFVHHSETEREAEVRTDGVADDLGWQPVVCLARACRSCHPVCPPDPSQTRKPAAKLTVPPHMRVTLPINEI